MTPTRPTTLYRQLTAYPYSRFAVSASALAEPLDQAKVDRPTRYVDD